MGLSISTGIKMMVTVAIGTALTIYTLSKDKPDTSTESAISGGGLASNLEPASNSKEGLAALAQAGDSSYITPMTDLYARLLNPHHVMQSVKQFDYSALQHLLF